MILHFICLWGVLKSIVAKNEATVKLLDASGPVGVPLNASEVGGPLLEYVVTFPNVTVNSGDLIKSAFSKSRTWI
jgi:hypothetical protein